MFEMSSLSSNGQPSTRSRQANSGDRTTAQLRDIRQKQLSHVLYWRFFVNLALMLIDAAMYIIAGATVLNLRHEATPLYSSRFNFTIDSTVYLIIVACFWVWSLYVAGIYHRHVMGDGYQLNVLLVKGMVVCWVVQCAFNYFFNLGLTLTSLCLVVIAGWLLTMVERIASRAFITRSRRKGAYAYGTVIIGSPHGIGRTLQFLGQRRQLNYRPVAVCPIHLNPDTGLIEQSADHETLREEMQKNKGCQLPVLEYSDHNLAEQIIDMNAQTVMVADELRRYSDNYDIFSVRMESFGLEIAMLASAADTSNHEIQVRSVQGTTIITQRLAQYTPARRLTKRLLAFRCLVWVSGSGGWCWSGSLGVWIPRRCSPPPCNCLTRGGCRAWSSVTRRTADGNCISRSGSRRVRGSPARNRGAARPRVRCMTRGSACGGI